MNELIEKLKKNQVPWKWLDTTLRAMMLNLPNAKIVVFDSDDNWVMKWQSFSNRKIYRIHEDYQPAPDTPQFEGYELWPVDHGCYTKTHANKSKTRLCLHEAINFGCVGYVFKEWPRSRWNTPIMFVSPDGQAEYQCLHGYKPATLGWVAFKE